MRRKRTAFLALLAWLTALLVGTSAQAARYVVVYDRQNVPADAAERIATAGGRLVAAYDDIGVVVADSENELFRAAVLRDRRVAGAATTELMVEQGNAEAVEAEGPPPGDLTNAPATDADTFSGLQWNMQQIHSPEAHAITGGSPAVVVGAVDTGIDASHPNLDGNIDAANSVSCVGGAPNQAPSAWDDDSGHGTHVAGIIAAESNGIGVVGVAPHVKIASIKASQRVGTRDIFRPEAVICALMWAGGAGFDLPQGQPDIEPTIGPRVDVANNSYTVDQELITDPLDFFCRTNPDDREVIKAVGRAARFAMSQGVTLVASAGNNSLDLAHPPLGNECLRLPSELPGVVTVSSTRRAPEQKSSFSNYGVGVIDVAAPGGEVPPVSPPPTEFILSTWPAKFFVSTLLCDPVQTPCPVNAAGVAYYRFMAGTSMSAAHVSGVAALVVSRFGDADTPQNGKMRPGQVTAIIQQTADPIPCPPQPTTCEGGETNGWYGHGRVNALRAVTHDAG